METKEILNVLKECADFELEYDENGRVHGFGNISIAASKKKITSEWYRNQFYPEAKRLLESLPWTKVVKYPRNPEIDGEDPTEDGIYLTMMDCNEHEVCTNTFENGRFYWMNRTHIKWWMPLSVITK